MSSDFYGIYDNLPTGDLVTLLKVSKFMEEQIAPIINDFWVKDEFPFHIIPAFRKLGISNVNGPILMEMARIDPSIATFFLVQYGLAIASIEILGTDEQKQKWLPSLKSLDKIGCFAMTEPLVGSAVHHMETEALHGKDIILLSGKKRWSGNSPFADVVIVWANVNQAFIVDTKQEGFSVEKIENKFGLKCVQNGLITLNDVRVPKENFLGRGFKDILRSSRVLVAWLATGVQMGAYELALKYAKEREQFGKPIASFQLIQDLLVKILGNLTACQCMMLQLSKLDFTMEQASLAKAFTTSKMRESVAWAREIFGGNGLSIDYNIGRFFADAEAIYSYEGTYQIQNLIVGKAITGESAFV